MRNQVILVNQNNDPIGMASKEDAHSKPLLHRAFSVFLYHGDRMLIQRRAFDKYHSGGLWANTCCSHPREDETVLEAAKSRLKEEAGISCELFPLFEFVYCHQFEENLYEHEYDHVFIGDYNGEYHPNPEEISEMKWVTFQTLQEELSKEPGKFAPWFLLAAPKVLSEIQRRMKLQ
ncbi:isopentenyl-diphosphate Delta-isomerase [Sinanaerobacter sp. ZZT-01]|uniref:isopentenyl-diphosphate Delta-isomerase n=1 Tax=Sinanaerobacter sp. ZZT-01 TaxID=3111540 RepID=UPI002D76C8D7|nr:isopentenyl-diphosphate Delta-isomerase [Sinanaerobacter sp. ZZT-01]WRR92316.1 isopentenyl-diphosphate Delta-isomerase [Sinanaerobacter sp. ZZT-01]